MLTAPSTPESGTSAIRDQTSPPMEVPKAIGSSGPPHAASAPSWSSTAVPSAHPGAA